MGYSTAVAGGERRWLWGDMRTFMQVGVEPTITAGTTAQYWRGDKSWQTLNAAAVGLANVENTALSTWAGSGNITILGPITPRLYVQEGVTESYFTDGFVIGSAGSLNVWNFLVSSLGVLNLGHATAPSGAGDFTTYLTVSRFGVFTTVNTTDASSTSTGSLIVPGGVGIAKSCYALNFNGNTLTAGTYTLTGSAAKTLAFTNTLTISGTDGTTMTFPGTSATLARTDAANTFTGASTGTSWTLTTVILAGGLTASGAGANTWAGSSGIFITSTGANTLSGAVTINDAATPSLTTASGKTNTGFLTVSGKTSGSLKITTADATAQVITITTTAQTVGASTLTLPNFASVSDTFVFTTLAQTLSNKTFVAPVLGTPTSGTVTNLTGTATININGTVGATTANSGAFTTITATGLISSSLTLGNALAIVSTQSATATAGAVTIGNGTAATNIGMGGGIGWFGAGIVLGTSPSAISGFLTISAGGSANQVTGYAGSTQIWGMGRDVNGVLIDSFDTVSFIAGSGGTARSGTKILSLSATTATIASGSDLKLGRARAAGVVVQGGTITVLDSGGGTVTLLTT